MEKLCLFLVLTFFSNEIASQNLPGSTRVPQSPTMAVPSPSVPTSINFIQDCIRSCPVTSEYNPVCGSNSVTYDNPGRLQCAQACGINVNLLRMSRCPPPTPAPSA